LILLPRDRSLASVVYAKLISSLVDFVGSYRIHYSSHCMFYILDGNVAVDTDDTDTEDAPRVTLAEMLDDMHIAEDATGEAGAPMMD